MPRSDDLDLAGQARPSRTTRRLLEYLLQPKRFQTSAVLGHAKLFFNDFQPAAAKDPAVLGELKFSDAKLREYVLCVARFLPRLIRNWDDAPLAAALDLSRQPELDAHLKNSPPRN